MTACSQRYNYLNHGPPGNTGTPAGSYIITVEAQSSTGVKYNHAANPAPDNAHHSPPETGNHRCIVLSANPIQTPQHGLA